MTGVGGRTAWIVLVAAAIAGCGATGDGGPATSAGVPGPGASRPVIFVGFDASQPLVRAMEKGQIQGLVVQNPLKMAELSVKTLVKHLEKQPVEGKVGTGETLVTPARRFHGHVTKFSILWTGLRNGGFPASMSTTHGHPCDAAPMAAFCRAPRRSIITRRRRPSCFERARKAAAGPDVELSIHVREVGLDRLRREENSLGDLPVGHP